MIPVVLWDIDGTLVRGRGQRITLRAFVDALELASQLTGLKYPKDSHGKTDLQIAGEMLAQAEAVTHSDAERVLLEFAETYLQHVQAQRERLMDDLEVLPGVKEILHHLKHTHITQSLLTGNLEPVARIKLGCVGLDSYVDFDIGAFGSDHRDRDRLVPIVRERLRQRGHTNGAEIVVVGDTPRDIACARAGGAHIIAVATGNFTHDELGSYSPDAVFENLADTDAVMAALLRYS